MISDRIRLLGGEPAESVVKGKVDPYELNKKYSR